jgi:endonuclease/exonuclease/phosphatase family metal-dependent hydrolase
VSALRIATWNLGRPTASQSARHERLTSWLQKINADIWILTETHSAITLGNDFHVVATTRDRTTEPGGSWTAILSRFPMSRLGASCDPARAIATRVEPPGRRPIVVYGTVLPWLGSSWGDVPAANGAAFAAALNAQADDWKRLQADDPGCDLVVAGDLNQDLVVSGDLNQNSGVADHLNVELAEKHFYGSRANRAALAAAFQARGLTCLTGGVNDPVRLGGARAHATIDHLCVSARLAAQARWPSFAWPAGLLPTNGLSDHFGTAADFNDP